MSGGDYVPGVDPPPKSAEDARQMASQALLMAVAAGMGILGGWFAVVVFLLVFAAGLAWAVHLERDKAGWGKSFFVLIRIV